MCYHATVTYDVVPYRLPRRHRSKESPVNAGDARAMNQVEKIPWKRAWQPTPETPMDIGAWGAT